MFIIHTELKHIETILNKATDFLCALLLPSHIIRSLKTNLVFNDDDEKEIKSHPRMEERVNQLLIKVKRREKEAYFAFMEALKQHRHDLFLAAIAIESKCRSEGNIFLAMSLIWSWLRHTYATGLRSMIQVN